MPSTVSKSTLSLALLLMAGTATLAAGEAQPAGPIDWDELLAETEAVEDWIQDPLAGLGLLEKASPDLIFTASAAAGPGHSSNFLKRGAPIASAYVQAEVNAFLNWFLDKSTVTAFMFAEAAHYAEDLNVNDEYMVFGQLGWTLSRRTIDYGVELQAYYADQIYDASLGNFANGDRIRQLRPEAAVYADWYAGRRDRLRLELNTARADYDIENEDFLAPGIAAEWERLWVASVVTKSRLQFSRQWYDDAVGRPANPLASPLPGAEDLRVDVFSMDHTATWKPAAWKRLQVQGTLGISWNNDRSGRYEALRQSYASLSPRATFGWGQLRLAARWMELRYDERWSSISNSRPLLQTQRSLKIELKRNLPLDLAVTARAEWTRFTSSNPDDAYAERRVEALLEWSY